MKLIVPQVCSICIAFASCPRVPPAPASSPPVIQPLSLCPLAPVRRRFDESQLFASRDGASPTPAQPQPRSPTHRPEPTFTAAARLRQRLRTHTRAFCGRSCHPHAISLACARRLDFGQGEDRGGRAAPPPPRRGPRHRSTPAPPAPHPLSPLSHHPHPSLHPSPPQLHPPSSPRASRYPTPQPPVGPRARPYAGPLSVR